MKHHLLITITVALTSSAMFTSHVSAQEKAEQDSPAIKTWHAFTNLPEETREEFNTGLTKAQSLFTQKRILDSLDKANELDKIFPNHPAVNNIKGACYVELRSFDKARALFVQVINSAPNNNGALFNLAEIEFVTKNWQTAHNQFEHLITQLNSKNKTLLRLCEFKLLLCKIKLGQIEEATAMKDKYDQWDDSPFYHYSRAALLHLEGKEKEFTKEIQDCRIIWSDPKVLSPWQDTVMEYGITPNIFEDQTSLETDQEDKVEL